MSGSPGEMIKPIEKNIPNIKIVMISSRYETARIQSILPTNTIPNIKTGLSNKNRKRIRTKHKARATNLKKIISKTNTVTKAIKMGIRITKNKNGQICNPID